MPRVQGLRGAGDAEAHRRRDRTGQHPDAIQDLRHHRAAVPGWLQAALAAAEQDRYWNFIELFYANQGTENSGYVTDDFLTAVAEGAGVDDLDRWNADRASDRTAAELAAVQDEALGLG